MTPTAYQATILLVISIISLADRFCMSQLADYHPASTSVFHYNDPALGYTRFPHSASTSHVIPPNWARGHQAVQVHHEQVVGSSSRQIATPPSTILDPDLPSESLTRRDSNNEANIKPTQSTNNNRNVLKSARHIVNSAAPSSSRSSSGSNANTDDICSDRLCYGLPSECLGGSSQQQDSNSPNEQSGSLCSVLVTSKRFFDPNRPVSRDILFELIALPNPEMDNYAAVGFSETGRMQGLVSECIQYREPKTQMNLVKLKHSYNIPGAYHNVPATILTGIKSFSTSFENGYYQCRWIVESAVEFSYEATNGTIINKREDLGYKNYHILLASGEYNASTTMKQLHIERSSSTAPVSLAQTGQIKSLSSHILIRIHGSLMIAIWVGMVTLSIVLARYYKNEWSNSRVNDLAIWFVVHRAFMLISWFGTIIAVVFAYIYTETYHPGFHQLSGTACLVLSTVQVIGGLFRPSSDSSKRIYFNWTHFICGNLSYLFAMICLITAAFLAPAHLPPLYIWVIVIFVAAYALTHLLMTIHQYILHKSSKISITPMGDLNSSPFRQFMLGILVTIIVIFIVLLISLVNR